MKSAFLLFELPRLAVAGSVVQILPGRRKEQNRINCHFLIFIEDEIRKVISVRCSISDTW